MVGDRLEYNPTQERLGTLVTFEKRQGEWHWIMRPEVAQALESLRWVEGANLLLPEEIATTMALVEGAVRRVSVNAYERNPKARRRCIARLGISSRAVGVRDGNTSGWYGIGSHAAYDQILAQLEGLFPKPHVQRPAPALASMKSTIGVSRATPSSRLIS